MAFDYAGAKAAGYSDEEIQSYLSSKQETPAKPGFWDKVGSAAPGVGSTLGALGGGIAGTVIAPGAGTAVGAGAGAGAGYGAGKAIQENIMKLQGKYNAPTTSAGVVEDVMKPVNVGIATAATGKIMEKGAQLVSKIPGAIKSMLPEVKLGGKASQIAGANKTPVDATQIIDRAKQILNESKVVGSTKQKALLELEKITPDAPNTVIDALMGRRGVDKQIVRDLFGRPKSGVGKNVGLNAYRQALDEVIKKIPELAKIDKQLSTYYKIKDPVVNILTNKTVQAVGGGAAILKLLGITSKD